MRNPNSVRPWQHVLEPLSGYLLLAEKLFNNQSTSQIQNWNFAPNLSSCKSVKYVASRFAKSLKLKIKFFDKKKWSSAETDFLRLSNFKARKYLNWKPKWHLNKSIEKIIEWNKKSANGKLLMICKSQIKEFLKVRN